MPIQKSISKIFAVILVYCLFFSFAFPANALTFNEMKNYQLGIHQGKVLGASITAPELPRTFLDTTLPASSSTCTVTLSSGGNLQTAINNASLGDTICLQAGATFSGSFQLTAKNSGSGWITIRTSTPDSQLPSVGTRVSPSDASKLAKVVSPGSSQAVFYTDTATHNYRLLGLEVTKASPSAAVPELIVLGDSQNSHVNQWGEDTRADELPYNITLDRMYIHGDSTSDTKRGIRMNCNSCAIIDSYVSDIHVIGQDTQAVLGWNSYGPFKIVNNYLEASGENVMFGGADPAIMWTPTVSSGATTNSATLSSTSGLTVGQQVMFTIGAATGQSSYTTIRSINGNNVTFDAIASAPDASSKVYWGVVPSDFEIKHNYFFKPRSWKTDDSSYANYHWTIKNLFEMKNSQRLLVDGNIFENSWSDAQIGGGVLFKSTNQDGNCPWCITQDVTFSNNIIKNTFAPIAFNGHESYTLTNNQPPDVNRVKFSNNVAYNTSDWSTTIHNGIFPANDVQNLEFNHNLVFSDNQTLSTNSESPVNNGNFVFTNNIIEKKWYGSYQTSYFNTYYNPFTLAKNGIMNTSAGTEQANTSDYLNSIYDPGFTAVTGIDGVGFTNAAAYNFSLAPSSPFKNAGSDGRDIGSDISALNTAVAGVTTGIDSNRAPADTTPPIISAISSSVLGQTTASISWTSNEAADTQVEYGTTSSYGASTTLTSSLVTSHTSILISLSAGTLYHYRVRSHDSSGNLSVSQDQTFTTNGTQSGSSQSGSDSTSLATSTPTPTPSVTPAKTPSQASISMSDGSSTKLRLVNEKGTFYLINNGQKQGVTNPGMLFSYGLEFKDATPATEADQSLPQGSLLLPGDGALVKSPSDPTVWLISLGQKHGFSSEAVFKALSFKFNKVLTVTGPELNQMAVGSVIGDPIKSHLPGTDISLNGTMYYISSDSKLHGYPSLEIWNSWHFDNDFSSVVAGNAADQQLPIVETVPRRVLQ